MKPAELYEEILKRLTNNKPFTSLRSQGMRYEFIDKVNGWIVALNLTGDNVLHLTACHRRKAVELEKLAIATHYRPGEYSILLKKDAFDKWAKDLVSDEKPATIWDMFTQMVEQQNVIVAPGKEELLWESGAKRVTVLRETRREVLRLACHNGKDTLSEPLARWGRNHTSRNGITGGCWKLYLDAKERYTEFIAEATK